MKKIILLSMLISSVSYGQTIAPSKVKITNNNVSITAPFITVQETDGYINKINKENLVDVIEVLSAINLPTTGTVSKIYVTLDNNRLYRWTGTIYQEIANNHPPTNLDLLPKPSGIDVFSSTGTYITLPLAIDGNSGLMSPSDKTKLDALSNYNHPLNHPPSIITQDTSNRFVTDAEKTTWNAKQNALGYTAENVLNKGVSNGYPSLDSAGKIPLTQINDVLLGSVNYKGVYNASAGTPTLPTASSSNKGQYYKVSTAGTQYGLEFKGGDWIISDGTIWDKVDNNNAVVSVNNQTGVVSLTTENITDSTNKRYQTDAQKLYNDATSSIQTQVDSKQASLGFVPYNSTNPNGFISSVPAQSFASLTGKPTSLGGYGITDAIQNQNASAQSANMWISGSGTFGSSITANKGIFLKNAGNFATAFTDSFIKLQSLDSPPDNTGYIGISFPTSNVDNFGFTLGALRSTAGNGSFVLKGHNNSIQGIELFRILNTGATTFSSSVTATQLQVNRLNSPNTGAATFGGDVFINSPGASSFEAISGLEFKGSDYQSGYGSKVISKDNGTFALATRFNSSTWIERLNITSDTGSATFSSSVTASGFFNQSSDRRLKTIIKRDGEVAYFKWNEKSSNKDDTKTHIGYIAQEIRKEFPDQVQKGENGYLTVSYIEILVEKVRQLEKRINAQDKKIKKLQKRK